MLPLHRPHLLAEFHIDWQIPFWFFPFLFNCPPQHSMYRFTFEDCREIRMGSPHKACRVRIQHGGYLPNLSAFTFQDIGIVSDGGHTLYLIVWDTPENQPGFRILKLIANQRQIQISDRISGICTDIEITALGISVKYINSHGHDCQTIVSGFSEIY
jgi:hypothetical protein